MRKFLIAAACIAGFAMLASRQGEMCGHQEGKSEHHGGQSHKWMKEAKVDISDIENGVTITIASDKPEIVKKIQEWSRTWEESFEAGKCVHEKASGKVKDPVCGMEIDKEKALKADYEGETYYFCSKDCSDEFLKEPGRYIERP